MPIIFNPQLVVASRYNLHKELVEKVEAWIHNSVGDYYGIKGNVELIFA